MNFKFLCLSLLILVGCNNKSQTEKDIVKIKLKELNDDAIDISLYEGKTIFINFWATWCKPCIQEMPTIVAAQDKFKNEKIVFLLASNEDVEQIQKFIKKRNYNFHYVHLENLEELKIQALPATFIFNSQGKLKFSESGYRQWDNPDNIELITKIMNDNEK